MIRIKASKEMMMNLIRIRMEKKRKKVISL
jgi:hypothetical protein